MGAGASIKPISDSPHDRLMCSKRIKAMKKQYKEEGMSELYLSCRDKDHAKVREILQSVTRDDLRKLSGIEPNGDTSLHAAIRNKDMPTVKLLVEHGFHADVLDRNGKFANEDMDTDLPRNVFARGGNSKRFYESDTASVTAIYTVNTRKEKSHEEQSSERRSDGDNSSKQRRDKENAYVATFDSEEAMYQHALNQQTTAMWLRMYNWVFSKFGRFIEHPLMRSDSFDLDQNKDFEHFIDKGCDNPDQRDRTMQAIKETKEKQSIEPLIKMYTDDRGCYRSLNKQLTNGTTDHDTSPHMCDRFVMEFFIRAKEIEDHGFVNKKCYRGAAMPQKILGLYRETLKKKHSVIAFKPFTSTSEKRDVAIGFMEPDADADADEKVNVLFVIDVKHKSVNIFGIKDISCHPDEAEVLIMPGTLFRLIKIIDDVEFQSKDNVVFKGVEIYLEYVHIPISSAKKLKHTYASATNTVL